MKDLTAVAALAALLIALGSVPFAVRAKPVTYDMPEETARLKPGPGIETAEANCLTCHSADYLDTQPRGPGFGKEFWQGEVTKMIKTYGAPITDEDATKIVDYLSRTY